MTSWVHKVHENVLKVLTKRKNIDRVKFGAPFEDVCINNDIPNSLLMCFVKLIEDGPYKREIFRAPGSCGNVKSLLQHLHQGKGIDFNVASTHAIASVLKIFLQKLPGGFFGTENEKTLFTIAEQLDTQNYEKSSLAIKNIVETLSVEKQHFLAIFLGTLKWISIVRGHIHYRQLLSAKRHLLAANVSLSPTPTSKDGANKFEFSQENISAAYLQKSLIGESPNRASDSLLDISATSSKPISHSLISNPLLKDTQPKTSPHIPITPLPKLSPITDTNTSIPQPDQMPAILGNSIRGSLNTTMDDDLKQSITLCARALGVSVAPSLLGRHLTSPKRGPVMTDLNRFKLASDLLIFLITHFGNRSLMPQSIYEYFSEILSKLDWDKMSAIGVNNFKHHHDQKHETIAFLPFTPSPTSHLITTSTSNMALSASPQQAIPISSQISDDSCSSSNLTDWKFVYDIRWPSFYDDFKATPATDESTIHLATAPSYSSTTENNPDLSNLQITTGAAFPLVTSDLKIINEKNEQQPTLHSGNNLTPSEFPEISTDTFMLGDEEIALPLPELELTQASVLGGLVDEPLISPARIRPDFAGSLSLTSPSLSTYKPASPSSTVNGQRTKRDTIPTFPSHTGKYAFSDEEFTCSPIFRVTAAASIKPGHPTTKQTNAFPYATNSNNNNNQSQTPDYDSFNNKHCGHVHAFNGTPFTAQHSQGRPSNMREIFVKTDGNGSAFTTAHHYEYETNSNDLKARSISKNAPINHRLPMESSVFYPRSPTHDTFFDIEKQRKIDSLIQQSESSLGYLDRLSMLSRLNGSKLNLMSGHGKAASGAHSAIKQALLDARANLRKVERRLSRRRDNHKIHLLGYDLDGKRGANQQYQTMPRNFKIATSTPFYPDPGKPNGTPSYRTITSTLQGASAPISKTKYDKQKQQDPSPRNFLPKWPLQQLPTLDAGLIYRSLDIDDSDMLDVDVDLDATVHYGHRQPRDYIDGPTPRFTKHDSNINPYRLDTSFQMSPTFPHPTLNERFTRHDILNRREETLTDKLDYYEMRWVNNMKARSDWFLSHQDRGNTFAPRTFGNEVRPTNLPSTDVFAHHFAKLQIAAHGAECQFSRKQDHYNRISRSSPKPFYYSSPTSHCENTNSNALRPNCAQITHTCPILHSIQPTATSFVDRNKRHSELSSTLLQDTSFLSMSPSPASFISSSRRSTATSSCLDNAGDSTVPPHHMVPSTNANANNSNLNVTLPSKNDCKMDTYHVITSIASKYPKSSASALNGKNPISKFVTKSFDQKCINSTLKSIQKSDGSFSPSCNSEDIGSSFKWSRSPSPFLPAGVDKDGYRHPTYPRSSSNSGDSKLRPRESADTPEEDLFGGEIAPTSNIPNINATKDLAICPIAPSTKSFAFGSIRIPAVVIKKPSFTRKRSSFKSQQQHSTASYGPRDVASSIDKNKSSSPDDFLIENRRNTYGADKSIDQYLTKDSSRPTSSQKQSFLSPPSKKMPSTGCLTAKKRGGIDKVSSNVKQIGTTQSARPSLGCEDIEDDNDDFERDGSSSFIKTASSSEGYFTGSKIYRSQGQGTTATRNTIGVEDEDGDDDVLDSFEAARAINTGARSNAPTWRLRAVGGETGSLEGASKPPQRQDTIVKRRPSKKKSVDDYR